MLRPPAFADTLNPSHLDYKTRARLAEDPYSYNSLWRKAYLPDVVDRQMADAAARAETKRNSIPYQEGLHAYTSNPNALSGFATNTDKPAWNLTSFKPYHNADLAPEPVSICHPRIAQRNARKFQLDYLALIRPDAETMNQTMRPLGTYATDFPHAEKTGIQIPHMTLGPKDLYWHPDVRLSDRSWATATQVQDSTAFQRAKNTTRRPVSAIPSFGTTRSRGIHANPAQQEGLERQMEATRAHAVGQQGFADLQPSTQKIRPTRPMSAGPSYGARMPGSVPHDAQPQPQRGAAGSMSRSSSARPRPQSAGAPRSPMSSRASQGSGSRTPTGPEHAQEGIVGDWGAMGPAQGPSTSSAYPTAMRKARPSSAVPAKQMRWAE